MHIEDADTAALADLVRRIESRFAAVEYVSAEIAPFAGFGEVAQPAAPSQPPTEILAAIDWRLDGRAREGATDQATRANIHEECVRLLSVAAKSVEALPSSGKLVWRDVPRFLCEQDYVTREILIGLFARGYVVAGGA